MSDTFFKIKGYVCASAGIVRSLIFIPLKTAELKKSVASDEVVSLNSPPPTLPKFELLPSLSMLLTIITLPISVTYQYDQYIKIDKTPKWVSFGLAVVLGLYIGTLVLQKYNKQHAWIKEILSIIAIQAYVVYCFAYAISLVIFMSLDCKKASPYLILFTINNFFYLADFIFIDQVLKKQPQFYYPVHAIRATSFFAESAMLIYEVYNHKEATETQPSLAPRTQPSLA